MLLLLPPTPLRLSDDTASRSLLLRAPAPLWTPAIAALLEPAGGEGIGMAGAAEAPGSADLERVGHHDILCVRSEYIFPFHGSACTHSDADKQQMRCCQIQRPNSRSQILCKSQFFNATNILRSSYHRPSPTESKGDDTLWDCGHGQKGGWP